LIEEEEELERSWSMEKEGEEEERKRGDRGAEPESRFTCRFIYWILKG
jgi:hypothetical protein